MSVTTKEDPAFPTDHYWDEKRDGVTYGMTLRDYFAAKALPEAIRHVLDMRRSMINPPDFDHSAVAVSAYRMVDAMLKERDK